MNPWRYGPKPVIGLVGGIGAGKTTAARCLAARGGRVIDADAAGHAALSQPEVAAKLVDRWGKSVQKADGSLDRRAIARIVFENPEERAALEAAVFPFIGERCREEIAAGELDPTVRFLLLDAAVMLEAGWSEVADRIVYVDAPRELRRERVAARSGWSEADLAARESAQWSEERKQARADAVLSNDGGFERLQVQVDMLLARWGLA